MNVSGYEIPGAPSSIRTLLVVADQHLSKLFKNLENRGWKIEYVSCNEAALAAVEERPFDLVVTSEASSAKDDLRLLRQLRKVRPHTRLIIVTGEGTTQDVIAALRERAFSYFTAPYTYEALTEMIRIALEGPAWDDGIEVISATPLWVRLVVRCQQETAERMIQFFSELVELPDEEKGKVAYAFREMLMNAIRHGAKFDPSQYVEIQYLRARRAVACRVKDPGQGFSFDELYHAAVSNPLDNPLRHILVREAAGMPAGGYGILLSQHLVDELIYNERGNEVLLIKYLDGAQPETTRIALPIVPVSE